MGNIVFGGTGSNRTVTVTPAANISGTSTITTVNDGPNNVTDTFVLTVTGTNTAPYDLHFANQSTSDGTPTAANPFTVGDEHARCEFVSQRFGESFCADRQHCLWWQRRNRTVTVPPRQARPAL